MITGLPSLPPGNTAILQRNSADVRPETGVEARQQAVQVPPEANQASARAGRDAARNDVPESRQVIEPASRQREVFPNRPRDEENLPFSTQQALKAFAENAPSPGQQLGIELAGIDTYA